MPHEETLSVNELPIHPAPDSGYHVLSTVSVDVPLLDVFSINGIVQSGVWSLAKLGMPVWFPQDVACISTASFSGLNITPLNGWHLAFIHSSLTRLLFL